MFPHLVRLLEPPSPESCETGSFSRALRPLRSYFADPPGYSSRSNLSGQGFFPLRDVTGAVHSARENTLSRFIPPAGFLSLSTACSVSGFVGLLHPTATCRVFTVQGFLPIRSRPDSSPGRAPLSLPERPLTTEVAATASLSRLRGFDPRTEAFFKVGVNRPLPSLPSSDSSSSRLCSSTVNSVTRAIHSCRSPQDLRRGKPRSSTRNASYSVLSMDLLVSPSP
jgi:hypothetical protein